MKPEEALALLHAGYRGEKRKEFEEAVEEALKKQIPIKPHLEVQALGRGFRMYECECDAILNNRNPYCWRCGQALTWKGVE